MIKLNQNESYSTCISGISNVVSPFLQPDTSLGSGLTPHSGALLNLPRGSDGFPFVKLLYDKKHCFPTLA